MQTIKPINQINLTLSKKNLIIIFFISTVLFGLICSFKDNLSIKDKALKQYAPRINLVCKLYNTFFNFRNIISLTIDSNNNIYILGKKQSLDNEKCCPNHYSILQITSDNIQREIFAIDTNKKEITDSNIVYKEKITLLSIKASSQNNQLYILAKKYSPKNGYTTIVFQLNLKSLNWEEINNSSVKCLNLHHDNKLKKRVFGEVSNSTNCFYINSKGNLFTIDPVYKETKRESGDSLFDLVGEKVYKINNNQKNFYGEIPVVDNKNSGRNSPHYIGEDNNFYINEYKFYGNNLQKIDNIDSQTLCSLLTDCSFKKNTRNSYQGYIDKQSNLYTISNNKFIQLDKLGNISISNELSFLNDLDGYQMIVTNYKKVFIKQERGPIIAFQCTEEGKTL